METVQSNKRVAWQFKHAGLSSKQWQVSDGTPAETYNHLGFLTQLTSSESCICQTCYDWDWHLNRLVCKVHPLIWGSLISLCTNKWTDVRMRSLWTCQITSIMVHKVRINRLAEDRNTPRLQGQTISEDVQLKQSAPNTTPSHLVKTC